MQRRHLFHSTIMMAENGTVEEEFDRTFKYGQ